MIELSVGLPMYRAKHIAWLALESLCRQEGINFEWELLIYEEKEENFGEQLEAYKDRLKSKGCVNIMYKTLDEWIPLSRKWRLLARSASETSLAFVLQASDCYSQPFRLCQTHKLFKSGADWVHSPRGIFYDISTGIKVLYAGRGSTHLNMAVKTKLIKKIPQVDRSSSVDSWLFRSLNHGGKEHFNVVENTSSKWKRGLDTNGLNNISSSRNKLMKLLKYPFVKCPNDYVIEKNIPKDILDRLQQCKKFCRY